MRMAGRCCVCGGRAVVRETRETFWCSSHGMRDLVAAEHSMLRGALTIAERRVAVLLDVIGDFRAEHNADTADTVDGLCGCAICEKAKEVVG